MSGKRIKTPKNQIVADYHRIHFEDSRDILFVVDRKLTIKAASPSMETVLGYSPRDAERKGIRLDRFLLSGQGQGIRRLVRAALAGRETWPAICEARTRDGGTRTLEFVAGRHLGHGAEKLLAVSARDITEWQRMADAVRQSELKYRSIVEATDTGFVILDRHGRVVDANLEYLRLTGRKQLSAIQGKNIVEWVAPHDQKRIQAELAKCLRRGSVRMLETDYLQPDGTLIPVEINATLVESEAGFQIVSTVRDISRRREMETALRDSERQYRLLVQNQGEGIGVVDQAERFVFANPAAEEIFGVSSGGLIGRTLRDFTTPEQYAELVRQTGLRRQGLKSTYELCIRRSDGQTRLLLITATPQSDRQGKFYGTFGIFRDITERQKAEEALRASEQLYRTVVETSYDAIVVSDISGRVVAANQRAAGMQGMADPSQLVGLNFFDFIVPEDRTRAIEDVGRVLMGKPGGQVEYRIMRRDGSVFDGELSATLLPGADGRLAGFVAAIRDITERKRLEKEVLEISDRVQYHIGHDLHDGVNQLLMVASLRLGALRQKIKEGRLPEEEEMADLSGLVRQTMDHVSSLARGLSPLSLETGGLGLGLTELCNSTAMLGMECRASIDESVKINDLVTATHLYRIAQEAVNNAIKHSGANRIEISLRREKEKGVLEVSDNGRGMSTQIKSKGMGLNIMKYRAGMIGAELELRTGQPGGTVVRCVFTRPLARERK